MSFLERVLKDIITNQSFGGISIRNAVGEGLSGRLVLALPHDAMGLSAVCNCGIS